MKREQRKGFREFVLREVCQSLRKLWKGIRWSRDSTPKQATLPVLRHPTTNSIFNDLKGKADILLQPLLPPVHAELDDLTTAEHPPPKGLDWITREEIRRGIQQPPSKKAPGSEGITKAILNLNQKEIAPVHYPLFNSLLLEYYPTRNKGISYSGIAIAGKG